MTSSTNVPVGTRKECNLPSIALIGEMGAGKTTALQLLVDKLGYTRIGFSHALKVLCGTTDDREVLQRRGMEGREVQPDLWVDLVRWQLMDDRLRPPFVLDDLRFPNEYWFCKGEGFIVVEVQSDRNTRLLRLRANGRLQDESQLDHISETSLPADEYPRDAMIGNHWTAGDLWTNLQRVVTYYQLRTAS